MLKMGSKKLKELYKKEQDKASTDQKLGYHCEERDYLPFKNKILRFAEMLDGQPRKPLAIWDISNKTFEQEMEVFYKNVKTANQKIKSIIKQQKSELGGSSIMGSRRDMGSVRVSNISISLPPRASIMTNK